MGIVAVGTSDCDTNWSKSIHSGGMNGGASKKLDQLFLG
jgi:hypothetical protein